MASVQPDGSRSSNFKSVKRKKLVLKGTIWKSAGKKKTVRHVVDLKTIRGYDNPQNSQQEIQPCQSKVWEKQPKQYVDSCLNELDETTTYCTRKVKEVSNWQEIAYRNDSDMDCDDFGEVSNELVNYSLDGMTNQRHEQVPERTDLGQCKSSLEDFFQRGMDNYRTEEARRLLQEAQVVTGLSTDVIKRFIDNTKRKEKKKNEPPKPALPKKYVNAYSCFLKEHLTENQGSMQSIASAWRAVKSDGSQYSKYTRMAEEYKPVPLENLPPGYKRKVIKDYVKKLNKLVKKIEATGLVECGVVIVDKGDTAYQLFGTEKVEEFFANRADITFAMTSYCLGDTSSFNERDSASELRNQVKEIFTQKYREATGVSRRCSYKEVEEGKLKVCGMPHSLKFKRPSSYGRDALNQIIDSREGIKFLVVTDIDAAETTGTRKRSNDKQVTDLTSSTDTEVAIVTAMRDERSSKDQMVYTEKPVAATEALNATGTSEEGIIRVRKVNTASSEAVSDSNTRKKKEKTNATSNTRAKAGKSVHRKADANIDTATVDSRKRKGQKTVNNRHGYDVCKDIGCQCHGKSANTSTSANYEIEDVIGHDHSKKKGFKFLIKWKGWSSVHNTWEPSRNINDANIDMYFKAIKKESIKLTDNISSLHEVDVII